jgi:hypothetical protein
MVVWCYLTKDSERRGEIHKFQQDFQEETRRDILKHM